MLLDRLLDNNKDWTALAAVDFLALSKEEQRVRILIAAKQVQETILSTFDKIDSLKKEMKQKRIELYKLQNRLNGLKQLFK